MSSTRASDRWQHWAALLLGVLAGVGCGAVGSADIATLERAAPTQTAPPPTLDAAPLPPAPMPPTPTVIPSPLPCLDPTVGLAGAAAAPPTRLVTELETMLADPVWEDVALSASIWVDGFGEIVAVEPDLALLPASNQKIFTALGAFALLDPDHRFVTEVRRDGDHLVLVAGGDPTLGSAGSHSLAELARQTAATGVTSVSRVLVDASHFESATTTVGRRDWQMPAHTGPLSALTVDDNRGRTDPAFLEDPALGNAELFVELLAAGGVRIANEVAHGSAGAASTLVASLESAPARELVGAMSANSDNEIAEALVREIGGGATGEGLERIEAVVAGWCFSATGTTGDGSGLSRASRRSAREWRHLLQLMAEQPWGSDFADGLAISGQTGTLASRLGAVGGSVRAKTGSIIGGNALSGYATTNGGREVVFSIIVNGPPEETAATAPFIDALVALVVQLG